MTPKQRTIQQLESLYTVWCGQVKQAFDSGLPIIGLADCAESIRGAIYHAKNMGKPLTYLDYCIWVTHHNSEFRWGCKAARIDLEAVFPWLQDESTAWERAMVWGAEHTGLWRKHAKRSN